MSGNQQHPDPMCKVFILAPTDLPDEPEVFARRAIPWIVSRTTPFSRVNSVIRLSMEGITVVGPDGAGNLT
jgi:hypothetical protein